MIAAKHLAPSGAIRGFSIIGRAAVLLTVAVLGACATSPTPSDKLPPVSTGSSQAPPDDVEVRALAKPGSIEPDRRAPPARASSAVIALLDEAGAQAQGGELDRAAATLERALRIEPGNAGVWHDLAEIRFHQGQYRQAEELAARSRHLAGGDKALQASTWRLTAKARRARGDRAGASAADAQAVTLERSL